ncbi:NAD+ synthase [Candidatus Zixiibacteriota bacterium]
MNKKIDPEKAVKTIKEFIADRMVKSGLEGYVIGLSGGIDSALSAVLAVEAIGKEKLYGVLMPYKTSSESSVTDAVELVNKLGIDHKIVDISPMIDIYYDKIDDSNRLRAGNKMARERMAILFDIAFEMNRMVLGTGNRTEIALGYTTWYGDAACSIDPIGQLYKTEVRQIAKLVGVPESIINKPPSADLWVGQTDEDEIGVNYSKIDNLLKLILDQGISTIHDLIENGIKKNEINRIIELINKNAFKRNLPEIAPLGRVDIPDRIHLEDSFQ